MNNATVTLGHKDGASKLMKPKFGPGMLLRAEDLDLLKDYTRDLNRLMFGSLFGCGVICGLVVTPEWKCDNLHISVQPGVALACSGDPVQVVEPVSFYLDEGYHPELNDELWVLLCGTTKCCAPRTAVCASDDDDTVSECTREKDTFQIKVVKGRPTCVCGCLKPKAPPANTTTETSNDPNRTELNAPNPAGNNQPPGTDCMCADPTLPCYEDHYAGRCGCHCDECSDCDCKCIVLARVKRDGDTNSWKPDHSVRRFVRPILMRDPQIVEDQKPPQTSSTQSSLTMEQTIDQAAERFVRERTEPVARRAAREATLEVLNELGKRATKRVMRRVAAEAAERAVIEALEERAARERAVADDLQASDRSPERVALMNVEETATDIKGQESTQKTESKQTKASKGKGGLPPRS
jgi:hypothetical protein